MAAAAAANAADQANVIALAHNAAMLAMMRRQYTQPPPHFAGRTGGDTHRWLQNIALYFEEAGIDDDASRLIAAGRVLDSAAASWWEGERARINGDPLRITTWVLFVAALRKRFEPVDLPSYGRQQLTKLIAKGMTNVVAYTEQFQEINSLIPAMDVADRIHYYSSGLPPHIRAVLANKVDSLLTLQQNIEAAIRSEASRAGSGLAAPGGAGDHSSRWQARSGARSAGLNQIEGSSDEDDGSYAAPSATASLEATIKQMQSQLNAMSASFKQKKSSGGSSNKQIPGKARTPGLSNELAAARIKAHLCINCGGSDHFKFECTRAADTTTHPK